MFDCFACRFDSIVLLPGASPTLHGVCRHMQGRLIDIGIMQVTISSIVSVHKERYSPSECALWYHKERSLYWIWNLVHCAASFTVHQYAFTLWRSSDVLHVQLTYRWKPKAHCTIVATQLNWWTHVHTYMNSLDQYVHRTWIHGYWVSTNKQYREGSQRMVLWFMCRRSTTALTREKQSWGGSK